MEVNDHHNPRFNRDAKESDVTNPHGHTEVVAKQPLQDQPSGHRIERGEDQDHGLSQGMENHVQEHENHEKHDG